MNIGIDQLSFYTPHYYLELAELAAHHHIDPAKYRLGIGQERMAVAPPDEDIISMAANAAAPILQDGGTGGIDTVLFATETSIDQAKSAAVSVHRLLQLPANSRTIELKQACYSATAALQLACAHIARHPARKVLILAADIAKYDLDSAAEPTQGAAAVAMLISANPRLATIAPESGLYSEDIYDFWRPNHRKTPLVDGKYSTLAYLKALEHAWQDYRANGGRAYEEHAAYCYHLPFNKMGIKAHAHLARINGATAQDDTLAAGLTYSRETGNSYTASLYASLAAMLDNRDDLGGKTLAIFGRGNIGRTLAGYAQAFGMKVIWGEHKHAAAVREGYTPFQVALQQADAVSLHCPLNEHTRHMIGAAELRLMKPTAILINTGRGGLADEQAVFDALQQGRLGGAGFDVLSQEPPRQGNPLLASLPNLIVTPHIAWASQEALLNMTEILEANITAFAEGRPQNVL